MSLRPGDVVRLWDRFTRSPREKRVVCVCPEQRLFLRIDSRPTFPPHLPLRADETDFLDHDSFVQLQQLVRYYKGELDAAEPLAWAG